jgi:hypothetical protein
MIMPRRFEAHEVDGVTKIVIPSRKHPALLISLMVWLTGWLIATVAVERTLIAVVSAVVQGVQPPHPWSVVAFVTVWWIGWSLGGWLARKTIYWMLFGSEVIATDDSYLTVSRKVGWKAMSNRIPLESISDLRPVYNFTHEPETPSALALDMVGKVEIDAGGRKPVRFGCGLTSDETKWLIEFLKSFVDL